LESIRSKDPKTQIVWDCMDNMSAFHRGLAADQMRRHEQALWSEVDVVWASSKALFKQAKALKKTALWVPNGICSSAYYPQVSRTRQAKDRLILGFVGSIAPWVDWSALIQLAHRRPADEIRLIGPLHTTLPSGLPANVVVCPPIPHGDVPQALAGFDWGLIPFEQSALTEAVDPIKFYEYRAAGLPVLSTAFGDMRGRGQEDGVWDWHSALQSPQILDDIAEQGCPSPEGWLPSQDWSIRFQQAWAQTEALTTAAYNRRE
jgi:glycosyltransferase involved in cell wall biosynthesis